MLYKNYTQVLAFCCMFVAGLLHFVAVPERNQYGLYLGAIFIILGIGQIAFGLIIAKKFTNSQIYFGIGLNAALVVLFLVNQYGGSHLPVTPEPLGISTIIRKALEVLTVLVLSFYILTRNKQSRIMGKN